MLKTRFSPSPTGYIHIGNVRTALFSALLARKQHGTFLIRIEDTDLERSKEEYVTALLEDMRWLGIAWQEGPEVEGEKGPYWQSQRNDIYSEYYQRLEQQGRVYPCFCTSEQLELSRKLQRAQGKPPRYAGTCRELNAEEIARKLAQGLKPALRFHVTARETVQFHDLVKGRQRFNTDLIGDFVIRRGDGTPAFFFCNAIDDALMGVTHVIRGEDHLTNTPRQLLIMQALRLPAPEYGHVPLIVGAEGGPLSKREGSFSIREFREEGYLPLAILNYLARLGHHYTEDHFRDYAKLADEFSLDHLSKALARFDIAQLNYWQQEAIRHTSMEELCNWGAAALTSVPAAQKDLFLDAVKLNIVFPADMQHWADVFFKAELQLDAEKRAVLKAAGKEYFTIACEGIASFGNDYQKVCDLLKSKLNVKGKALFMPLRLAITGEEHGPELAKIFALLPTERLLERLKRAGEV